MRFQDETNAGVGPLTPTHTPTLSPSTGAREKRWGALSARELPAWFDDPKQDQTALRDSLSTSEGERAGVRGKSRNCIERTCGQSFNATPHPDPLPFRRG